MLRIRHIQTTTATAKDGTTTVVPVLDAEGRELELWAVDIPSDIEATEGTREERQAAIDNYVQAELARRAAAASTPTAVAAAAPGGTE